MASPPTMHTPVDPRVALIEQVIQLGLGQQELTDILLDDRVGEKVVACFVESLVEPIIF